MAAALVASIPENVRQAAQSAEWAAEVLFYTLLDRERETREQQLLLIAQRMGADSEARVRALLTADQAPTATQRLPLLELSFPALKRRPPEFVARVLAAVQELVMMDGRVDVFEYLLAALISQHLRESQNPHLVRTAGNLGLSRCMPEASRVLAVLAVHGQDNGAAATAAFRAGMNSLAAGETVEMPNVDDWVNMLDEDLPQLDRMRASDKQRLVNALLLTVEHDGKASPVELELLRVSCSLIHVPLPMLHSLEERGQGGTEERGRREER